MSDANLNQLWARALMEELVRGGVMGKVSVVHVWTTRPVWPQGIARPQAVVGRDRDCSTPSAQTLARLEEYLATMR